MARRRENLRIARQRLEWAWTSGGCVVAHLEEKESSTYQEVTASVNCGGMSRAKGAQARAVRVQGARDPSRSIGVEIRMAVGMGV